MGDRTPRDYSSMGRSTQKHRDKKNIIVVVFGRLGFGLKLRLSPKSRLWAWLRSVYLGWIFF